MTPPRSTIRRVLVTGGAGYVGSVLVPKLLASGREVVVYDALFFGRAGVATHPRLELVEADLRDSPRLRTALRGVDAVVHLACVSNDPSFELDPAFGRQVNFEAFGPLVDACVEAGTRRFINVSTSSVYGVNSSPNVTEEQPLRPLTDYSRFKALCEEELARRKTPALCATTIRPATVCGFAPRMRLDLAANMLAAQAIWNRKITVLGGAQKRPHIHIDDLAELYERLLDLPEAALDGRAFNAGAENLTIAELAGLVRDLVERELPGPPVAIDVAPSNDARSYHIDSSRLARELGFSPARSCRDAVVELCRARAEGRLPALDDPDCHNVRALRARGLGREGVRP